MQRKNPLLTIIASLAGIFLFVISWLYIDSDFWWNVNIKLKDLDTVMGVGVGVNLALGVLKGIRDSICLHFKLRFSGVKSNFSDKSQSLLQTKKITESQAQDFESSIDNLSLSIENNKAHTVVQTFVIFISIAVAASYLFGLTIAAFNPNKMVSGFWGVIIVLLVLLPVGLYVLFISLLAAYPEHKLRGVLKTLSGFGEVVGNGGSGIKPISPTK